MAAVLQELAAPASDFVTVLKSAGPLLTKVFDGDTVKAYDDAKHYSITRLPIRDITELSATLRQLETRGRRCIIRGDFVGDAQAQKIAPPAKPGLYLRNNDLFVEAPHHWAMFDIDNYESLLFDPVTEPVEAINAFIESELPEVFHGAAYHWQLSSSAGQPGKEGKLKCHLWFWLETAYTGPQLKVWVRANKLVIDVSPFRRVQVHYVANPVFQNGAIDPVPLRSGLERGRKDSVALGIPEEVLASADVQDSGSSDVDLVDPTEKPGMIGAFCRCFPISRVITELLPEEFQFAVGSDRRVTWLQSDSGSPEGCFVTDDDHYLGNQHNGDPFDNRLANAFDLVRWYKFGHLDQDLDLVTDVFTRPSYRAMLEWCESQEEVRREVTGALTVARTNFGDAILQARDEAELRNDVLPEIRACSTLEKVDREHLAKLLQGKWKVLLGTNMRLTDARDLVAPERPTREINDDAPGWAKPWVFCTDKDRFFNLESGESVSITGFNMMHDRHMRAFMDDEGNIPPAHLYCKNVWDIETVAGLGYMPGAGPVFEMLGVKWANLYSDRDVPQLPPVLTDAEERAVACVEEHLKKLFPDDRERSLFVSWLAYNVRNPGAKIRWAPFIYGAPGVGKSFFLNLLGMAMGSGNVSPLDAGTICNSDFTGWAVGAAVRCIEEVKLHGHNAHDVTNKLKQFLTNNVIDVHSKGRDPYRAINKTNYMALSNYIDGLPLEEGDRRYTVLHCSMTREEARELAESGYFEALFGAIETFPGAMRKWLTEYQLHPEFDPDGQAPMTAAKELTIELSKSDIYVAAEELLEEGAEGVSKDVVSSNCFSEHLTEKTGKDIYTRSVNTMLTNLGFRAVGVKKWKGKAHRVWVSNKVTKELTNDEVRWALDSAGFEEDFLK